MRRKHKLLLAMVVLTPGMASAQQGVAPAPVRTAPLPTPGVRPVDTAASAYVLGPDDEIEMKVFGQDNMSLKTRIRADGTITAPFLGNIQAAGRTTAQLAQQLSEAYLRGGYLSRPSINIEVTNYASKSATVLGSVGQAGLYPLDRPYTVAAMVARAGGPRADGANTVILTPMGGQPERISLADVSGGAARLVQPGDTLFVPVAEQVYVYGQVEKGGGFPVQPGMTFRQALALAGGPTLAGSTKRIEVRRGGKVLPKATLDDVVQPEDVLVIKEKWF
ncbi:polysaccharide export outer membrane protein [Sphingomonas sp. SORGH_AS 950]|uniref:polysaccharide biosynthesis/export family protein n=1 Tax=unclassified Sphingomonas TaxID=196159 RepID=UPI00277E8CEA|nr:MULTISPECIES: polysaccharide biosynthesis/export family protein [unclassified Sphingomonas]MDQ1156339.1 polysaccharide export outer membrane protein [Sphingomonas sp. SORGH_AS_0950]MDR6115783.1 polysaccharide export outer membrane protein [Sphingomonas sp. SORGH_AS_0789]MDR6150546.1 polysaccharide export outer membrane protein [Sphingomonas sp. SORGH_AS_0742]